MRKETINTFSDGMSLDLNPLGTPAKTLTNCLNGTLVTYNGNELTLQNDMGNVEVGTAALPKGYVPVGMKEYGGIIYVASYNPETKKGQLGCFPSPQQIYISEASLTLLDLNLYTTFLLDENIWKNIIPIIDNNEYKEEIFKDSITQEAKIFNTGDKFIIKTDTPISKPLREAIDKNIITLKLFIIPLNGDDPIEISNCEHNDLKLYSEVDSEWEKDLWIFQNVGNLYLDPNEDLTHGKQLIKTSLPFETILNKYRNFLLTFPGPQGTLEIVFEFNTFKLFNLYRKFYKQGNNFKVKFIGEAFADDLDSCNIVNEASLLPFALSGKIDTKKPKIEDYDVISTESNGLIALTEKYMIKDLLTLYYDLMPTSRYGALKLFNNSFLKSGKLNNKEILNSHNKITNWNFEVDSNAVTIKWTYTTFNTDSEINHMRFVLIPLDILKNLEGLSKEKVNNLYITGNITPKSQSNIYRIKKLLYSGDFEDRILFIPQKVEPNYIYLCRLDVIYQNGQVINGQDYKLLYTGTFFNNKNLEQFNYYNRPKVEIYPFLKIEQSYNIKSFRYVTLLEDESGNIKYKTKDIVTANDVMFLADDDKYYNKLIGIIVNVQCEIVSTLSVDYDKFAEYNKEKTEMHPLYAGNFNIEKTLDNLANGNKIKCILKNVTTPVYEGNIDLLDELDKRIKSVKLIVNGEEKDIDGLTIEYVKLGNTYLNTSTINIRRGIISKMGHEDFHSVLLESLFPVYDPDDLLYNERLFGFEINENGDLSNIIGGENFMGLSLWLAKNRKLDATTSVKDSMIEIEKSYGKKTALSRFDFKGNAQTPYHYGSYISEDVNIVNYGSEGTSRIEALLLSNYAPIQILASNEYERVWDKSYWDGDVDSRICNLMVLPHSEVGEKLYSYGYTPKPENHRDKHYGSQANNIREWYVNVHSEDEDRGIENIGKNKRSLFKCSHGSTRSMYILWRSQYGYQIMNLATPLDIETNQQKSELITVTPSTFYNKTNNLYTNWDKEFGETLPICETHLRADHMLLCLLSQILITKKKSTDILVNSPNISLIVLTSSFKSKILTTLKHELLPIITLGEYNIEELIKVALNNEILDKNDIFIPKFIASQCKGATLECGGKITNSTDRFGLVNIEDLFYAEGQPEFSNVTDEQRLNIYPGIINSVLGTYLCQLEKDKHGLYKVNEKLVKTVNGRKKFYKIFLPVIHSHTNDPTKKYYCKNLDIYKQILEGFAYNDVLFPLTRVLHEQGKDIKINSLEDVESPFFNLLYYNSINLGFYDAKNNLHITQYINGADESNYDVPIDFTHGFAFVSLFGDLSRYLDADVFIRNKYNEKDTVISLYGANYNKGYIENGYNKYTEDDSAFETLPELQFKYSSIDSTIFTLGTLDWVTSTIDYTGGRSDIDSSDLENTGNSE